MHIIFVSSISSTANLAKSSVVPEAPIEDPLAAMNIGYGQSKLAAERILLAAHQKAKVPVSIIRIGQVGGSSQGDVGHAWPDQPWISALIRSSKTLGCFPDPVAPIDWIPVDTVARVLEGVALQFRKELDEPQFLNVITEPRPGRFLLDVLREAGVVSDLEVVSLSEWVKMVREMGLDSGGDVDKLPALRLLDFYHEVGSGWESLRFETSGTKGVLGGGLEPVERSVILSWLRSWDL